MKNDVNSINIAPVLINSACLRMMGIAMLPTVDAPVKNLAASTHLSYQNPTKGRKLHHLDMLPRQEQRPI